LRRATDDYTERVDTTGLPGGDIIDRGLQDLADGVESAAALLVLIGAPRLQQLGVVVPASHLADAQSAPEHRLYALLAAQDSDSAHSRYNALIRTLVSFERAAECAS
jgi:hypothetical protein